MKVVPEVFPTDIDVPPANELHFPHGLIGFAAYTRAELLYLPGNLPFLWMKIESPQTGDTLQFVVIEPGGIVPGYEPELFEADTLHLDLRAPADALVLNIVTLQRREPLEATVNLIGPIVVNRRTRCGRQIVISNYSQYSANYSLVENPPATVVAGQA